MPKKDTALKKETKKNEEKDIPMDNEAVKAYSSVIADAAEDSVPETPVLYNVVNIDESNMARRAERPPPY